MGRPLTPSAPPQEMILWPDYAYYYDESLPQGIVSHCATCCCNEAPPPYCPIARSSLHYQGYHQEVHSCSLDSQQRVPTAQAQRQDERSANCPCCKNMNNSVSQHQKRHKRIKTGINVAAGVFFPVTLLYLATRTNDPYDNENNKGDLEALTNTTEKVLTKIKVLKHL